MLFFSLKSASVFIKTKREEQLVWLTWLCQLGNETRGQIPLRLVKNTKTKNVIFEPTIKELLENDVLTFFTTFAKVCRREFGFYEPF